MIGHMGTETRP